MDHRDMRVEAGGMTVGMGTLYRNTVFAKRTQLKNVDVFSYELVI
jgi:hypothetical protein